jgi:single-stranded-DNA-specific exonuclease
VTRSALGRLWHERCDGDTGMIATAIAQTYGLPDLLARVLAGRGVDVRGAPAFLAPRLRDLMPDPNSLVAMPEAAARLADAVQRGERVAIFGDYDVDGACSAALLADYLEACGVPVQVHIPDRITEGYGPNVEAMRSLVAEGARLIVTVDCGTAGHEPLAEAARLGAEVVVLDHHGAPEELPQAVAIVNPNRQDDLSGLGHLCAAGVVFMTLVALARELRRRGVFGARPEPDLLAGLDLVALATVADVVPLKGLNRAFVRQGLVVMRQRSRPGLAALADVAGLQTTPECWHLGYLIGPRINAGGRIGDAALGARLLRERDPIVAGSIAAILDRLNRERQVIEAAAVEEAEAMAHFVLDHEPDAAVVVTASPDWHPGIVGLVASRLKERFGRPAFAFALRPDGTATGSGRSVPGADLGRAVRNAVESGLAIKGGGHAMAAGATIKADALPRFRAGLEDALRAGQAGAGLPDFLAIDGTLTASGAVVDIVRALEGAGPFGQGHPEPVFAFGHHRLTDVREVGAGHLRITLKGGDGALLRGVAFRAAGQPLGRALADVVGLPIHAAGTLAIDRWGGGEKVELRVLDAASD